MGERIMVAVTIKTSTTRVTGVDLPRVPVVGDHIYSERDGVGGLKVNDVLLVEDGEPVVFCLHVDLAEFR